MISKGTQYLSAAGFGNIRVTAASMGKALVFWDWLLYATKQAILGAFGARDGAAVIKATNAYLNALAATDRTKATALAGVINEDPMMVCSLGLEPELTVLSGMPLRGLGANGTSYVKLAIKANQDTKAKYLGYLVASNGSGAAFMAGKGASQYIYGFYNGGSKSWDDYNDDYDLGPHFNNTWMPTGIHEIYKDKAKLYIDGTLIRTAAAATFDTDTLAVLAVHYGSTYGRIAVTGNIAAQFEIETFGQSYWFFATKQNGAMKFVDILTGDVCEQVGTFSEAYVLPDGTPWTPSTP